MEDLLTPVRISYRASSHPLEEALVKAEQPHKTPHRPSSFRNPSTPVEALEILRSEPDHESLVLVLCFFARKDSQNFNITSPSPLASQLVHVLVSDTVPNYWNILSESQNGKNLRAPKQGRSEVTSDLKLLLSSLRSVTGLNAVLLNLKQLIQKSNESKKAVGGPSIQNTLVILLQVLTALLEGDGAIESITDTIWNTSDGLPKQKAVWIEFLNIVAGGKILGIAAEAEDVINELSERVGEKYWIADGSLYSRWLARNIVCWVRRLPASSDDGLRRCNELLSKSFRLGYAENFIKEIVKSLLLEQQDYSTQFERLLGGLPNFEQRNFIYSVLKLMPREYMLTIATTEDDSQWWQSDASIVSAAAHLISLVLASEESRKNHMISWLTSSSGAGAGDGIAIRRAAMAAIAGDKNDAEAVLDKSLHQFGDHLYIRHTPTIQQEVHAQVLLLSAGYVYRKNPLYLARMMRSGAGLSVISSRLAASSLRARFLGMVVGEALSDLVDKGDKKMDFKIEEMNTPEAKWYKSLVDVSDTVGSLEPLKSRPLSKVSQSAKAPAKRQTLESKISLRGSKIVAIEEVDNDDSDCEDSDNDGLLPHDKPDSDQEDSDEDPTLITRNKPTAPVYIRDLISYLRNTENYDKQKLALETAAALIRRKSSFGTEVSSHAEELATLLVGLQDKYDMENFQDMRLQGMIAILIAQPLKMGQWFSKTFFDGDYSLSQRASILNTIGLGGTELGGSVSEGSNLNSTKPLPSTSFPSKTLPDNLHRIYASESTPVDKLSNQLSNTMIVPMATDLADKLTGPTILKVRTFSTRMEVEKKRKRPIANSLAKVVADGFFFPLTGRFFIHLKAYGSSRSNVVFQPYLLSLFIKTLSLLIHASGPSTLSLPQMTSEFWDLLLGLRMQSIGDITLIEALLFAFLTILEINEDKRRLVEAHGRQMLETQEWAEGVFGRVGAGGSDEDEKVLMLAAGCLVRIREVVEKYQTLLMGDLACF